MNLPVMRDEAEFPDARPSVPPEALEHRDLLDGDFWRRIPAFKDVSEEEFLDHRWQMKNTITKPEKLLGTLQGVVSDGFIEDCREGFRLAPMAVRISPYLLSLIDWQNPMEDPLRLQFLPVGSTRLPDHPRLTLDSLAEQEDAPVQGLTHRYQDKALFLALDTCPVYCRFCTRSYAVGPDQENVEKVSLKAKNTRWDRVFEYLRSRPEIEDVVISGGDSWNLRADQIETIGNALIDIPHIRRMRFASKGPAVMPQKALTDDAWFAAFVGVVERGRKAHKDVCIHTHFNNANEITEITRRAMNRFHEHGVVIRNQSVLQRNVNDTPQSMGLLVRRMSYINVHAYYVYVHDLVRGTEELRTRVQRALELEKHVRGMTAGFNTPTFVVDAPGGGGKRTASSFEAYDRETGISVYTAPSVKPGRYFLYYDPIDLIPEAGQARWADPDEHHKMVDEAIELAKAAPV